MQNVPEELLCEDEEDNDTHTSRKGIPIHPAVRLFLLFILMWQCYFHVSDAGIAVLFLFLHHFLRLLSSLSGSKFIQTLAEASPLLLYSVQKLLGVNENGFIQYVVCPKCHSIYDFAQCVETVGGSKISKRCWYTPYPNHPQVSRHNWCGTLLLSTVHTRTGNTR